jgi:DnaD/phage-associated family protein
VIKKFKGFPPGKVKQIQIPAQFFSDLLPLIDDAAELKVTLFCFMALHQKEGKHRFLRRQDFAPLLESLGEHPDSALETALAQAVERESLLLGESRGEKLYFMNSAAGRESLRQLQAGTWQPDDAGHSVEIMPERPNIYALYEANIGALTPMIAEALKDAEREYPAQWVADAMRLAVAQNKRNWRYIESILKRWQLKGKDDEKHEGNIVENGQRRIAGNVDDFIKR